MKKRQFSYKIAMNFFHGSLFSFHVMKENYRKAAHVMFECGSRLGLELVTVVGLKKQVILNLSVGIEQ